ncbi:MAG: sel1 repeat family protein [Candidatus Methanomethylophilaceae archaeon]|nr:sel1 repeat family protein [Candidatus Methanomethylophilaceae archaeon]
MQQQQFSFEDYVRMAEQGNPDAKYILATKYRNGEGVEMDKEKAAQLYRELADTGDSDAQYDLAFMLDNGEGIPQDRVESDKYFKLSADQGDSDACLCYGGILFEKGNYKDAEGYFMTSAMKGDVKAEYNLGLLCMGEYLGEPDLAKAKEWFESAADKGFAYAQSMMGSILLDQKDLKGAEEYFRYAAEQDEPSAQYNLGALGLSNQIPMEYAEAVEWVTKSAKNGFEPAFQLLLKLNSQ